MKRGTKITVFIVSMALTVGSLVATVGAHRHGYCGMNKRADCGQWNNFHQSCGWNSDQTDSIAK